MPVAVASDAAKRTENFMAEFTAETESIDVGELLEGAEDVEHAEMLAMATRYIVWQLLTRVLDHIHSSWDGGGIKLKPQSN